MAPFEAYVWAAYAISLAGLALTAVFTLLAWRKARRGLRQIQDSETNL